MAFVAVHSRKIVVVALFLAIAGFYIREVSSLDLSHGGIITVTNDTRYFVLHPDSSKEVFDKEHYAKGNIMFTSGQRIEGDRLILTYMDQTQYTRNEDVEVLLQYPAEGRKGYYISFVLIYADVSTTDCDAYFVDGGIGQTYCKILIACNKTSNFGYQIYLYGY
ncbi:uncharacterized protein LOC106096055 [Stomoxys calcitrans]|uniref:Uncharacterized protein n=1 Tax=Stomoxys calcitrans TaxID=35570 RepID=A0A1I8NWI4_STOCA|nr:uncharacterized protein LOC106096055 [Stomoxys calcitrans]